MHVSLFLACLSADSLESVGGSVLALLDNFRLQTALEFALEWHHPMEKKISVLGCSRFAS